MAFVCVWSGAEPEGTERVDAGGRDATLIVWSPHYDGNGKACVRFDGGPAAIVGGSRVTHGRVRYQVRDVAGGRLSERDSTVTRCACSSPAARSATRAA